jgi:ribosome maturation factor RimP
MDKQKLTDSVKSIAEKVANDRSLELVHVEITGTKRDVVVRIYIDKPEGVTIDDCSLFSRDVEAVLDLDEDIIPSRYILEVSSPGIERELYSASDFKRFEGKLAKVKTSIEIGGQKTFVGNIVEIDGDTISIDDRTQGIVSFSFSDVVKANLKIDLSKEFQGKAKSKA